MLGSRACSRLSRSSVGLKLTCRAEMQWARPFRKQTSPGAGGQGCTPLLPTLKGRSPRTVDLAAVDASKPRCSGGHRSTMRQKHEHCSAHASAPLLQR